MGTERGPVKGDRLTKKEDAELKALMAEMATAHESGNQGRYRDVAQRVHEHASKSRKAGHKPELNEGKLKDELAEDGPVAPAVRDATGRFKAHE
jgi:hypothetical protein